MKQKRRLISDDEIIMNEGKTEVFSREELAAAFECGEWQIRRDIKLLLDDSYQDGRKVDFKDAWVLYLADLKRYALKLVSKRRGVQKPRINPKRIASWIDSLEENFEQEKQAAIALGGSWEDFGDRLLKGKLQRLNGQTVTVEAVAA